MYASVELTAAAERWRVTAENLNSEAERIGTLARGVFGPLGTDEKGGAVEATIDAEVEALIAQGERQLAALDNATEKSADARFQATSLLVGTLAISEALAAADGAPFGGLSIEGAQAEVFADARATVAETAAVVAVPASLQEGLEKLEVAGATESWEVVRGSVGKLAGGALVSGLEGVLKGAAAAAFAQLKKHLSGFVNVLKRAVVRITEWVVEKLKSFLPKSLAEKVDDLVASVQELLIGRASEFATDVYGGILGRAKTEDA